MPANSKRKDAQLIQC